MKLIICNNSKYDYFYRINHYLQQNDIQTVAMLTCVFGIKSEANPPNTQNRKSRTNSSSVSSCDLF